MRTVLFWSSGKDSAQALWELRQQGVDVAALFTTYSEASGRVPMHEVPIELVAAQAALLRLPLFTAALPTPCPNEQYARRVLAALTPLLDGATRLAFADLYLADIRRYREELFAQSGAELLFPLWQRDTRELAHLIAQTQQAVVSCVDMSALDASFAGRAFDECFLAALPECVDPCGENGEFHTYVCGGKLFATELRIELGELQTSGNFAWREPRLAGQ